MNYDDLDQAVAASNYDSVFFLLAWIALACALIFDVIATICRVIDDGHSVNELIYWQSIDASSSTFHFFSHWRVCQAPWERNEIHFTSCHIDFFLSLLFIFHDTSLDNEKSRTYLFCSDNTARTIIRVSLICHVMDDKYLTISSEVLDFDSSYYEIEGKFHCVPGELITKKKWILFRLLNHMKAIIANFLCSMKIIFCENSRLVVEMSCCDCFFKYIAAQKFVVTFLILLYSYHFVFATFSSHKSFTATWILSSTATLTIEMSSFCIQTSVVSMFCHHSGREPTAS